MWLDERNEFCDAEALDTGGTGTDLEGDVIDLGIAAPDPGTGEPIFLVIQVTTAVTSAGAATVQFQLASDAAAAIATDGSASVHWDSGALAKATLVAGYTMIVALPPNGGAEAYERYLGILVTVGTAALTAGAINAFLTKDPSHWKAHADATN